MSSGWGTPMSLPAHSNAQTIECHSPWGEQEQHNEWFNNNGIIIITIMSSIN